MQNSSDCRVEKVIFDIFVLMDENGPSLEAYAPQLAKRMYGRYGPRYILKKTTYSETEYAEVVRIIEMAKALHFQKYREAYLMKSHGAPSNCSCSAGKC